MASTSSRARTALATHVYNSPVEIFQHVYRAFQDSLPESTLSSFVKFYDAEDMLEKVNLLVREHVDVMQKTTLTLCASKISDFSHQFKPYFDIVGIFVSSNPEFAALAWGSIFLVFKLAFNHTTFIEKICSMFEQMAAVLPAYEEFARQLTDSSPATNDKLANRVLNIMAFVYSDLIQFCADACKIFVSQRRILGISKLKWPLGATLIWRPFDERFEGVLSRFKEHRELIELEMSVSSHTQISRISEKLNSMMDRARAQEKAPGHLEREKEQEGIDRRLEAMKRWIDPPEWLRTHDYALRRQCPSTSGWLHQHPQVQSWLKNMDSGASLGRNRVLSVQAKPGFGKTVLCASLVDYLLRCNNTVVFFYFDQQSQKSADTNLLFRAILCQLLEIHRGNKQGMDIAALLRFQRRSAQMTASSVEVLELLHLILSHTDRLFLVLDGIDESPDYRDLFDSLRNLGLSAGQFSLAMFSRPTVQLPKWLLGMTVGMPLTGEQNLQDIRRFLRSRVQELIDNGTLPYGQNLDETVDKVSNRANGMFLWVRLLLDYLESPGMTIRQRRAVIGNLNRLEGLDSLYGAIMQNLDLRFKGEARENVQRLFQWVISAKRPLLVSEVQCAIAIPLDRSMDEDDVCHTLLTDLSPMSGALLEVDADNKVRFIHLSALEYCQGMSLPKATQSTGLPLAAFCGPLANIYCSLACLSYLVHTVKHGPLAGSSHISLDRAALDKQYPFLGYVSHYWSHHLLQAINSVDLSQSSSDAERAQFTELLRLTTNMLDGKEIISTWIEASWTSGKCPHIVSPYPRVNEILKKHHSNDLLLHNIRTMGRLSQDLSRLNSEWGHVLECSPNEIWEPSISGFLKSGFWVTTQGARVRSVKGKDTESEDGFVCVRSRLSADGTEIGVIKVRRPTEQNRIIEIDADDDSSRATLVDEVWRVRFEIRGSKCNTLKGLTTFHVPASMVPSPYIYKEETGTTEQEYIQFLFPTSLSANLRHASFLNLAGSLTRQPEQSQGGVIKTKMQLQQIDFTPDPDNIFFKSLELQWDKFYRGYSTQMSDSGEYLLVLHLQRREWENEMNKSEDTLNADKWLLRVYQNKAFGSGSGPSFTFLSAMAFKPGRTPDMKERPFVFHPKLPLLAFYAGRTAWAKLPNGTPGLRVLNLSPREKDPESIVKPDGMIDLKHSTFVKHQAGTIIWNFGNDGSKPMAIYSLLKELQFSNDGSKIYGTVDDKKVMLDIPFRELGVEVDGTETQIVKADSSGNNSLIAITSTSALSSLASEPGPQNQHANSLIFARDSQGRFVASDLRQSDNTGALVLRTLREDSTVTQQTVTRLPKWVDGRIEATLLDYQDTANSNQGQDVSDTTMHIVLNRKVGAFEKYDEKDLSFTPTVIERQRSTIPKFVGDAGVHGTKLLGSGSLPPPVA